MVTDESVRLARMEMRQEQEALRDEEFRSEVRRHMTEQKELHKVHFETREKVITMEARAQGAWWLAAKVGAIASAISGIAAWIISIFMKGSS